ncbi:MULTISPECIES: tetratricopeptide repeat protein [Helicobacter]|uniref:Beta-lactamase n=1 Tax=Helicobacter mastomyrinus TaxID=287948 RepID=A0ABZ3F4E9_9HELI|nr:tetratricopeptide repeat protein [uncultured Helicobacter sp.]
MKSIFQCCLLMLMVATNVWTEEKEMQESPLLEQIRSADAEFYQGVVMWVKNGDEASKFLKNACDKKHPGACLYLGNYYEIKSQNSKNAQNELKQSQQYYQLGYENSIEACREGAIEWCAIQAVALIDGRGVPKDVQKGLEYLDIMCERDMENACFMLGSYYFYGINTKKDLSKAQIFNHKALELDSKACDEQRLYACVMSAEIYQQGLSVQMDLSKAKDFYHRACKLENQFACDYVNKLK